MQTSFVDRLDELAGLHRAVESLQRGEGAAVQIEGYSGIGKTALLDRFAADPDGMGDGAKDFRVVRTTGRPIVGEGLSYGPIIDILIDLQRRSGRRAGAARLFKAARRGAVRSTPEVLASLVPVVGPILAKISEGTESAFRAGSALHDMDSQKHAVAVRVVDTIAELARSGPPAVVIVDDLQFVDEDSLRVLDLLLRRLPAVPIALVLSRMTSSRSGRTADPVSGLVADWDKDRLVTRHRIRELNESWVAELVRRLEVPVPPGFAARLSEATGGLPMFVMLCLQHWRPQDGARIVLPESVAEIVEGQLAALDEADRRMLVLASVQGPTFATSFLAHALELPHDEVVDRIHLLARSRTLIRSVPEAEQPDWLSEEDADVYTFDHLLLWDAVYQAQSDEQRRSRHERLARVIMRELANYRDMPLGLRLELARHLELGGRPCLRESAEVRMALARSAASDGASFGAIEGHCEAAIAALRLLRRDAEVRSRFVEAAEMMLSMTEVRWRGQHAAVGTPTNIDELAQEAEEMAAETGDAELIARTALQRGKTLLATRGLDAGLEKLAEALDLAKRLDDPVRLYAATVEFGRQVSKRNLAEGLTTLREAERMYEADPRLRDTDDSVLVHTRNLAEMQLGVTLFDSGFLEDALGRLERCVARLREAQLNAELPIALNYLAQIQLAVGRSESAVDTLREALEFEEDRGGESGWHANNAALLALALSQNPSQDRSYAGESLELAESAWIETQGTWLLNLVPIVRNLLVEVLITQPSQLSAEDERKMLERADRLAEDTVVETLETRMTRSRIAALSLRSRVHLRMGNPSRAADFAREAVAVLDEVGEMPALRTEEILYHAACAVRADGAEAEANVLLARAAEVVERKANGIADDSLRRAFTEDVPLNRLILKGLLGPAER
jgi:tetratricopeptide (TPR) repeat protein